MDDNLEMAIQLREQGQFEESRNVLHALIDAKQDIALPSCFVFDCVLRAAGEGMSGGGIFKL